MIHGHPSDGRAVAFPSLFGVLLPAPVVAVAVWFFGKTIHDLYESIQAAACYPHGREYRKSCWRARGARLRNRKKRKSAAFDEPNREYVSRNIKLIRTWSMFMPSLQALIGTTF